MGNKVDWDFIASKEGKAVLNGYVPKNHDGTAMGESGVTVGTGFDLGQANLDSLQALGISEDLIVKLTPYLGLRQQDAIDFLDNNPLTITQSECDELMTAEDNKEYDQIEDLYNKYSDVQFGNLTAEQQTVIISVYYQYGSLPSKCPHFWNSVTSQQWKMTVNILRNFGDAYSNRRNSEADLLENSL